MRVFSVVLVLGLCMYGRAAVQVKVGDKVFPLEAAKQLKELLRLDNDSAQIPEASVAAVCSDPLLPEIFKPVCQESEATAVLSTLVHIITPVDPCEICANPSCFGCLK